MVTFRFPTKRKPEDELTGNLLNKAAGKSVELLNLFFSFSSKKTKEEEEDCDIYLKEKARLNKALFVEKATEDNADSIRSFECENIKGFDNWGRCKHTHCSCPVLN